MSSIYDKASLVLIPSGTKTSKVYSQKPVSGNGDFTFSRSTAATRVNADGNIEKETQNLLLQSNTFDTTWGPSSSISVTSGQAGYDGTNDAWLLKRSDASARYINQNITLGSSVYTYSVYAKPESENWMYFWSYNGSGSVNAYFDLQNGVVGNTSGLIDATIVDAGNGYYRCSITYNNNVASVRIYPAVANGSTTGGIVGAGIYIQDAQLEQGLVARDYIETTTAAVEGGITDNVPRLDYTDSSCPALLLEPQRTNIFLTSEWFGVWDLNAGTTLTYNYATSPEGVQNATRYVGTGASGFGDKFTLTSGTQYTISAYVKSNTGATQYCRLIGDSSNISSDLEVTTEWTRIYYTWTSGGLSNKTNGIFRDSSNNDIDILVYGLQLEQGSYATSYIPTYGTSVTRAQDQGSATGLSTTFNSSEGVLYAELKWTEIALLIYLSLSDGSNSNRILIYRTGTNNVRMLVQVGGVTQASFIVTEDSSEYIKVAAKYKANDFAIWVNGTERGTDTSGSTFSANTLNKIGFDAGLTGGFSGSVKQILVFDSALTDAELATLTTI